MITKELKAKMLAVRNALLTQKQMCLDGKCDHKYQYEHCPNHDASMWCQDCAGGNFQEAEQTLPDGTVSKGFYMTNEV